MKEYLRVDEELVDTLEDQYDDLSSDQIEAAVDVVAQRYGEDIFVSPEDLDLKEVYNEAVEIEIDGVDESPIYADPSSGEGDHLCVKWGNLGDESSPPEGRAQDGKGEDLFGIR